MSLPHLPELSATTSDDMFEIYVRDHLAGSSGGLALMRRSLGNNRGSPYEPALQRLFDETTLDRAALERVADHCRVRPSRAKNLGAWAVEKAGRLKLNGSVLDYTPLSRLWELEQLGAAVSTKTDLWTLLVDDRLAHHVPPDVDASEVLARCRRHVDLVEDHRQRAAIEAFAPDVA